MKTTNDKKITLNLTEDQAKNLLEFLEIYFIISVKDDEELDNIMYLYSMSSLYKELYDLVHKKDGAQNDD